MRWSRGCRFARWRDSILGQDLPESVGTIADWAALSGLVIVGVGLRRARRWARVSGWILGLALVGFGLYWLAAVKEPPPVPNLLTQAGMPALRSMQFSQTGFRPRRSRQEPRGRAHPLEASPESLDCGS